MIAHNLHPSDHCANRPETEKLCTNNTSLSKLLSVDVAGRVDNCHGIVRTDSGEEGAWVAEGVGERCQVGLELGHRTSWSLVSLLSHARPHIRRSHLLALEGQLGQFEADTAVVDGRWY